MNELHPIFEDIFKGIVKDSKKTIALPSETTSIIMDIISDENNFDTLDLLRDFINDIRENPKGVILEIDKKCNEIEEHLIEKRICPLCGGILEFEHDESLDTYVPYGDTQVIETEGKILKCEYCGYRSDDENY